VTTRRHARRNGRAHEHSNTTEIDCVKAEVRICQPLGALDWSIVPLVLKASDQFDIRNVEPQVIIDTAPGAAQLIGHQAPLALRPQDPERLKVLVPPDPLTLRNQVEGDVQSLFYALSGLALLIGAVAITNATLLNIIERRPEIGLRRALGATRSHITRQITLEAGLTGTIAGILGATIGLLAVIGTSIIRQWTPTIEPNLLLAAPVIGIATGTLAGIITALKASHTPPAETLRT
jgi:putative ABC transport system permease protein